MPGLILILLGPALRLCLGSGLFDFFLLRISLFRSNCAKPFGEKCSELLRQPATQVEAAPFSNNKPRLGASNDPLKVQSRVLVYIYINRIFTEHRKLEAIYITSGHLTISACSS